MKKLLALGVLTFMLVTLSINKASAQSIIDTDNSNVKDFWSIIVSENIQTPITLLAQAEQEEQPVKEEPPKPIEYTIKSGDNLSTIAKQFNISWIRIWQKNTNLTNQDTINVGDKLTIPTDDEVLDNRPLFVPPVPIQAVRQAVNQSVITESAPVAQKTYFAPSSAGNTYTALNCTWFVKNTVSWIPNGLGNANQWDDRARAMGYTVNNIPAVGSVGVSNRGYYGHVVRINSVNSDGTVNLSEMNFRGLGVITHRTVPSSNFVYIHP